MKENLARVLEFEYPCERCHQKPAVVIFDSSSVCARCHWELERALVAEGKGVS